MTKVKTVIFDLGNVVLYFDNRLIAQRLAAASGRSQDDIFAFISRSSASGDLDSGRISVEQFYRQLREAFALPLSYAEFVPAWNDIFTANTALEKVVRRLKEGGCRLAILSNTNAVHRDYILDRFPVMRAFDELFMSFELGLLKPDPEIYRRVLGKLGHAASETIFIDDIPKHVSAAAELGIQAVHFTSTVQLENDLERLGLAAPASR